MMQFICAKNEVIGLDAHVDETADNVGDVVGVDGSEDEVTGECGLNGDFSAVSRWSRTSPTMVILSGVVAQYRTQSPRREGQTLFLVDRNLRDAANLVFDRVFDGDDFVFVGLDFVYARRRGWWFYRSRVIRQTNTMP